MEVEHGQGRTHEAKMAAARRIGASRIDSEELAKCLPVDCCRLGVLASTRCDCRGLREMIEHCYSDVRMTVKDKRMDDAHSDRNVTSEEARQNTG